MVVAQHRSPVARSATAAAAAREADDEARDMLEEGQEVELLGPPAMKGKTGVVVGPVQGDAYAVRLKSGSVFNIQLDNIKVPAMQQRPWARWRSAWAHLLKKSVRGEGPAEGDAHGMGLPSGLKVPATAPAPVIRERLKEVWRQLFDKPRASAQQSLLTRVQRGWNQLPRTPVVAQATRVWRQLLSKPGTGAEQNLLTRMKQRWSRVLGTSAPPKTAPASTSAQPAMESAARTAEEGAEDLFTKGQEVVLTAPPAMAGNMGTIEGLVTDDAYAVRMRSGRVFNVKADSMKPATASGGGGGGRGFGGSGSGRGGDGQPPDGVGSSPEAGGPGDASNGGWQELPALLLCVVFGILLFRMADKLRPEPSLPARVDRRPTLTAGSFSAGQLAAVLLLAAAAYVLLSKVLAWLQGHFSSEEVLESSDVASKAASLLVPEIAPPEGTPATMWHPVRAGLALGAPLLVVAWVLCKRRSRARAARVGSKAAPATQRVQLACDEAVPEATPEVQPPLLAKKALPRVQFEGAVAKVHFQVELEASPGDRLIVVGGDSHLGAWDPEKTFVELLTDNDQYPIWTGTWCTNDSPALHEYKLAVVKETSGELVWEEIENRRVYVLPQEVVVKLHFNSPHHELGMS